MDVMDQFLRAAIKEAREGLAEGGLPIGSVLVRGNKIIAFGHNRRVPYPEDAGARCFAVGFERWQLFLLR